MSLAVIGGWAFLVLLFLSIVLNAAAIGKPRPTLTAGRFAILFVLWLLMAATIFALIQEAQS